MRFRSAGKLNFSAFIFLVLIFFDLAWGVSGFGQDQLPLQDRWANEKTDPMSGFRPKVLEEIRGKHVLFVSGIMNELAVVPYVATYFTASQKALETQLGVRSTYWGPSSLNSIPKNSELLYRYILRLYQEVKKPLVLIGHSKGGAEILYMILKHRSIVWGEDSVVDRAVLLQSAIHGSSLASSGGSSTLMKFISWVLGSGLDSLEPDRASQNFKEAFRDFLSDLNLNYGDLGASEVSRIQTMISGKIYYVRAEKQAERLSPGLEIVLWLCGRRLECDRQDGLLGVEAQKLDRSQLQPASDGLDREFGVDLGILNLDHMELAVSGWLSHSSDDDRGAFIRALFQQLFDEPSRDEPSRDLCPAAL